VSERTVGEGREDRGGVNVPGMIALGAAGAGVGAALAFGVRAIGMT
jgi:hypothetical protein